MRGTRTTFLGSCLLLILCAYTPAVYAEQQTVTLDPGWNLISFSVQADNPLITNVLAPIDGLYDEVWTYDRSGPAPVWLGYQPAGIQTLTFIQAGIGYWIHMDEGLIEPVPLTVTGSAFSGPIPLEPGWNMIGGMSTVPVSSEIILSALSPDADAVWGSSAEGGTWRMAADGIPDFVSLAQVRPGAGYWIHALSATSLGPLLSVAAPPGMAFGRGPQWYYIRIYNVGTGTLDWDVSAPESWLVVCPAELDEPCSSTGDSTGEVDLVAIGIDWGELAISGSTSCCGTGDDLGDVCTDDSDCADTCDGGSHPGDPCVSDDDCVCEGGEPECVDGTCIIGTCDSTGQWRCGLGTITVSSNAGTVELPVEASREPISAHYEGYATPLTVNDKSVELPKVDLAFDLSVDPDSGSATAVLTAEQTPFFPHDVYFHGYGGLDDVTLGTTFSVPAFDLDGMNMFGRELIRSITLRGQRVGNDRIDGGEGDYVETITFPGADSVVVRGTFQLRRTALLETEPCPEPGALVARRTPRLDKDSDGLPDDWEVRYALDPHDENTWRYDGDGDDRDNCTEYLDRTDPTVNDAEPGIPSISGTIEEVGSLPVPNVTVTVHFGFEVLSDVTDVNGEFTFEDLVPGLHVIHIGPHPGFTFTPSEDRVTLEHGPYLLPVSAARDTSDDLDFVAAPLEGHEPLTVQFVTLEPPGGMSDPAYVEWYFDGDTTPPPDATGWDPIHTYTMPGQYTVTMMYTLPEPDVVVTKTDYVRVGEPEASPYRLKRSVVPLHGAATAEDSDYRLHSIAGVGIADTDGASESGNLRLRSDYVP